MRSIHLTKISVGTDLISSAPINAHQYDFFERIEDIEVDTNLGLMTVRLRKLEDGEPANWGDYILYDLSKNELKWKKKTLFVNGGIRKFGRYFIDARLDKSHLLDPESGKELWRTKHRLFYGNDRIGVAFGYNINGWEGVNTSLLEGVSLGNGKVIWERKVNQEYGWNEILHLNDSVLLISAAGLHAVNLRTGKGWDFNAVTGNKDYTGTVVANAAGVALGLLTGTFVTSTGHSLVHDVVSDVLIEGQNVYYASKDHLVRFNHYGRMLWAVPLNGSNSSKSHLFLKNGLLYIVNMGFAFKGGREIYYGKPFVAAYNATTGEEVFKNVFEGKKRMIIDFKSGQSDLLLLFNDRIVKLSLSSGKEIASNSFESELLGQPLFFLSSRIYTYDGKAYRSIMSDTGKYYVYSQKGKVMLLNQQLEIAGTLGKEHRYTFYERLGDKKLLHKDRSTIVVDASGTKIAEFASTGNGKVVGSKLYETNNGKVIEIDLNSILLH